MDTVTIGFTINKTFENGMGLGITVGVLVGIAWMWVLGFYKRE